MLTVDKPMTYVCPMHPEVSSDRPGRCPKCGMRLVARDGNNADNAAGEGKADYGRLLTIFGLMVLVTAVAAVSSAYRGTFSVAGTMSIFMATFFLVFSGFKLLDLRGFAEGYSTYDILAKRLFAYGYVYPFIELAFGLAFLASFQLRAVGAAEIALMLFSGLGVAGSMLKRRRIQCACLGTIIRVPLGTVTLIEDLGMAAMGIALVAFM